MKSKKQQKTQQNKHYLISGNTKAFNVIQLLFWYFLGSGNIYYLNV